VTQQSETVTKSDFEQVVAALERSELTLQQERSERERNKEIVPVEKSEVST
jgi:hypothetical protein